MLVGIQLLLSVIVGLSVLTMFLAIRSFVSPAQSDDRLKGVMEGTLGPAPTLQQIEMQASFSERVIKPLSGSALQMLGRLAPQRNIEELHKKLETAGFPGGLGVVDFLGIKILTGVLIGGGATALILLLRSNFLIALGFGGILGLLGFYLPNYWLAKKISTRQHQILRALPDALDMMVICVDAGLGLSGAIQRVCDNWNNSLTEELTRSLAEVKLGRSNIEALESMAQRTGVKEVISFVMSLSMAYQLGINVAKVLRIQADQMRIARRQRAEELAHQAAIKMLFPLVFLIFPAMFAVILGPAVPQLVSTLGSL